MATLRTLIALMLWAAPAFAADPFDGLDGCYILYDLKKGKSKMPIKRTIGEYFSFVRQARRTLKNTPADASRNLPCANPAKPL